MIVLILRIMFGSAAAVMFAAFAIPMFSNIINVGNIVGALLSLWVIFVCVKPMFTAAYEVCSRFAATKFMFIGANALAAAFLLYGAVVTALMAGAAAKAPAQNSTAVVLGAQVRPTGRPSAILLGRINAATEYLEANPQVPAVLSGGKGNDEVMSEAECMYRNLVESGINPNRLYKEEASRNTRQNLSYSAQMIEEKEFSPDIAIVTDGFHQLRAQIIARKAGIKGNVGAVSSDTKLIYLPTYAVREWFALPQTLFFS